MEVHSFDLVHCSYPYKPLQPLQTHFSNVAWYPRLMAVKNGIFTIMEDTDTEYLSF